MFIYDPGIGMLFCGAGALSAGILEVLRKQYLQKYGGIIQILGGTEYTAAPISVLWQVPQFVFIGAGEVFSVIACEFYFSSFFSKIFHFLQKLQL